MVAEPVLPCAHQPGASAPHLDLQCWSSGLPMSNTMTTSGQQQFACSSGSRWRRVLAKSMLAALRCMERAWGALRRLSPVCLCVYLSAGRAWLAHQCSAVQCSASHDDGPSRLTATVQHQHLLFRLWYQSAVSPAGWLLSQFHLAGCPQCTCLRRR
jgi:hypothetical protein